MTTKKTIQKEEVKPVIEKVGCGLPCRTVVLIHLAILLVVLAALGVAFKKYWHIAEVNGREIRRIDYYRTLEQQGGKQVLEGMVQEQMILGEAEKQGVKVSQEEVNAEVAKVEEQIKAQGQTLDKALESQGMTKADLERQIRLKKLVTAMAKPAEITQAQIDKFIADNKAQLPPKATKAELEKIAKDQLTYEASSTAINTWLSNLKSNAKVIYK